MEWLQHYLEKESFIYEDINIYLTFFINALNFNIVIGIFLLDLI